MSDRMVVVFPTIYSCESTGTPLVGYKEFRHEPLPRKPVNTVIGIGLEVLLMVF